MTTTSKPQAHSASASAAEIYEQKDEAYFGYYSMLSHQAQMLQEPSAQPPTSEPSSTTRSPTLSIRSSWTSERGTAF